MYEVINDNKSLLTFFITTIFGLIVRRFELRKLHKKDDSIK